MALIAAIKNGADSIDIIGATGSRYDHTMTNIYNMKAALDVDISCRIYDAFNCIYLKDSEEEVRKKFDKAMSLKNFDLNDVDAAREYTEAMLHFQLSSHRLYKYLISNKEH